MRNQLSNAQIAKLMSLSGVALEVKAAMDEGRMLNTDTIGNFQAYLSELQTQPDKALLSLTLGSWLIGARLEKEYGIAADLAELSEEICRFYAAFWLETADTNIWEDMSSFGKPYESSMAETLVSRLTALADKLQEVLYDMPDDEQPAWTLLKILSAHTTASRDMAAFYMNVCELGAEDSVRVSVPEGRHALMGIPLHLADNDNMSAGVN